MDEAFQRHPERFVHGQPKLVRVPDAVWINAPDETDRFNAESSKKETPEEHCPGVSVVTSLTHPRSGYPSAGCVQRK